VPRTEVLCASSTYDPYGPHGAKPMSELPFNPVAPALANAVRDATGVRFTSLPLRRDVVYCALNLDRTELENTEKLSQPANSRPRNEEGPRGPSRR